MKFLIPLAAVGEILTGAALLIAPSFTGQLLLGAQPVGIAVPIVHVLGIALISLGIACWPGTALTGLLTYGALATLYLGSLAIQGQWAGPLLWPAVAVHALLTVLLLLVLLKGPAAGGGKQTGP